MSEFDKTPCRGCDDRYVGCHGKCDRYKEWSDRNNQRRTAIYEARMAEKKADECLHQSRMRRKKISQNLKRRSG